MDSRQTVGGKNKRSVVSPRSEDPVGFSRGGKWVKRLVAQIETGETSNSGGSSQGKRVQLQAEYGKKKRKRLLKVKVPKEEPSIRGPANQVFNGRKGRGSKRREEKMKKAKVGGGKGTPWTRWAWQ